MLGMMKEDDLVILDMNNPGPDIKRASSEFVVHRTIYNQCDCAAVLHAHPPYATLLSMLFDEIIPHDLEGKNLFEMVPIVSAEKAIGSEESSQVISDGLKEHRIVMLRGHGSFAKGATLEEAYMQTSSLEASSFITYHLETAKGQNKLPDRYKTW